MENQDPTAAVLRGWAARCMIAQDARWAMDVVQSAQQAPEIGGLLSLVIGNHVARVAFEGADALRSGKPNLGVPELAVLLNEQFPAITARARHVSKFLDNSSTNYESTIKDFEDALAKHKRHFPDSNLGLYRYGNALVGATIPTAYRLDMDIEDGGKISGEEADEVAKEWGRTLAVLGVASLDTRDFAATFDFREIGPVESVDVESTEYLTGRFEEDFREGLKLLILSIEGDLNTSRFLLSQTLRGHEMAVFRMREFSLYHSLTSLAAIVARFPNLGTSAMVELRSLLADAPTERLRSPRGLRVRDRCVHYPILNPTIMPDFSRPMYGIVESVFPEYTWEQFYGDVISVTSRVSDFLATWTHT